MAPRLSFFGLLLCIPALVELLGATVYVGRHLNEDNSEPFLITPTVLSEYHQIQRLSDSKSKMNTNNSTTNIPDLHPTSEEGEDGNVRPRVFLLHPNMSDVVADEGLDVSPKLVRIYDPDTADAWVMYTNGEPCKELLARKVLSSLVKRLQATNNDDMATRLEMLLQNNNVTQTC